MRLLRGDGPPLRIGHRGAAALAPENTLASLRAAIEHGVDAVEFDVLADVDDLLVLAHDLVERSLVSSVDAAALRELHGLEPRLALGLAYPEDRYGIARRRALAPLVTGGLAAMRRTLPRVLGRWTDRARARAAVLPYAVLTPALITRCHARGTAVFAWTVNDRTTAELLGEWGADAIITDDPRILSGSAASNSS